jgi:hypothetical protein
MGGTWGRRGQTPVVTVTGGSNQRVSLAALIAIKPGRHPRLIYACTRAAAVARTRAKGSPRPATPPGDIPAPAQRAGDHLRRAPEISMPTGDLGGGSGGGR